MANLQTERKKFNHYIIEVKNIEISNTHLIQKLRDLIKKFKITVVNTCSWQYSPIGMTYTFILSSSHLIVHTWPEYSYLHLDLFCCSNLISKAKLNQSLIKQFPNTKIKIIGISYEKNRL